MQRLALFGGPPAVTDAYPEHLPLDARELDAAWQSLRHAPLTTLFGGYDVERLERGFADRFGRAHAVAMSSGTASLHAAVAALDIGPGDEVIVTPHSFVASVSIVVQQGAIPVFCDLSEADLGIDVAACEQLVTPRTKAVLPVHLYGQPMDIEALAALCHRRGLRLIEDCAAALGATVRGAPVGSFGDVACYSFNVAKVLRVGEGGIATTDDAGVAERLRQLRVNGLTPKTSRKNGVAVLGYNYTLGQAAAAVGWACLERIDSLIDARRRNRQILVEGLAGYPLRPVPVPAGVEPVGYWTAFVLDPALAHRRDAIIAAARSEGVRAFKGFGEPLYCIDYLRPFAAGAAFPVAEATTSRIVAIDPSPFFPEEAMQQMVRGVAKVFDHLDDLV